MTRTIAAFWLAVSASLAASAKPLPLEPPDPARGIIGVRVKVIPPARIGSNYADAVYFVRVVEDADRFGAETLINSNYTDGRDVYLLNAKPGRYVAIGCRLTIKSGPAGPAAPAAPGFHVGLAISPGPAAAVFSKADILQTEVEVRAGAVAFMGAIEAHSSTKTKESDEAQAHYLRMVSPAAANQNALARMLSGNVVYTAAFKSIERGQAAEKEFWDEALGKHFTNELAWVSRIAHGSSAPIVDAAGSTSTAAAPAISPGGTDATSTSDVFLSAVCVDVNKVKARANGQPKEAAEIARLVCQTVMTDWGSQGCRENPDQAACRKRLASFDGSLKSSGSSMLFAAAQAGQTSICSVMLDMGSDPNAAISTGWTPLMIAAGENKPETVKLLLGKGASRDAKNPDGKTPAAIAAESGHPAIVELFTKAPEGAPITGDAGDAAVAPEAQQLSREFRGDAFLKGNIPANRLDGHTYTSPDGGFELTVPPLITPGAKAEERQVDEGMGVFFADELGNAYYVMRTDNTQLKYDLEKLAAGYTVNESLREKAIVATTRGSELRLAGVMPGGSPVAQQTEVKQETVLQKLDLHQAMSLFVTDAYIYEVAAGVTATHREPDAEMVARAKERLDAFLGGLRIKAAAPAAN